jgi:hypothetical protein
MLVVGSVVVGVDPEAAAVDPEIFVEIVAVED